MNAVVVADLHTTAHLMFRRFQRGRTMTEGEWLACEEPWVMLRFLEGKASDRKLRLFVCACVFRVLPFTPAVRDTALAVLEEIERYADGAANKAAIFHLGKRLTAAGEMASEGKRYADLHVCRAVADATREKNYRLALHYTQRLDRRFRNSLVAVVSQTDLLRCVVGNQFNPVNFPFSWRTDTVLSLASQMYDSRDFSAMPILADALQDAGCDHEDILSHCRDINAAHVRGCWVVDLVLGKE